MKNHLNSSVIKQLAETIQSHFEKFDYDGFVETASDKLEQLELKQRSNQITGALNLFMPQDFFVSMNIILESLAPSNSEETIQFDINGKGISGWIMMPVCDYVSTHAYLFMKAFDQKTFERALEVLKQCTKCFSSEFAVRPFLKDYPKETLAIFTTWLNDPNPHVRRLVSEGSRPYLPWGIQLKQFVEKPDYILPLLEALKDDESEYVRRSVANSLNDLSKVHGDLIAQYCNLWWRNNDRNNNRMLKHACRTLIKQGHPKVLSMLGYSKPKNLSCTLELSEARVEMGSKQLINLHITNEDSEKQSLLIDYAVHFVKANGLCSRKVFKWGTCKIDDKQHLMLKKQHSFKAITTRKYYAGLHKVEVLINGISMAQSDFELI